MKARTFVAALVLCGSASCAHATLDRTLLVGSDESGHTVADVPVRGFEVVVGARQGSVRGELLAVSEYTLWVETEEDRVVTVQRDDVEVVRVYAHESQGGAYAGWTVGGGVSTISHGWFAMFTAPLWVLVGGLTAGSEVGLSRGYALANELDSLRQYARFPQGAPPVLTGERPRTTPPLAPPAMPPLAPTMPQYGPPAVPGELPPPLDIPPPPPAYGLPTAQRM